MVARIASARAGDCSGKILKIQNNAGIGTAMTAAAMATPRFQRMRSRAGNSSNR